MGLRAYRTVSAVERRADPCDLRAVSIERQPVARQNRDISSGRAFVRDGVFGVDGDLGSITSHPHNGNEAASATARSRLQSRRRDDWLRRRAAARPRRPADPPSPASNPRHVSRSSHCPDLLCARNSGPPKVLAATRIAGSHAVGASAGSAGGPVRVGLPAAGGVRLPAAGCVSQVTVICWRLVLRRRPCRLVSVSV